MTASCRSPDSEGGRTPPASVLSHRARRRARRRTRNAAPWYALVASAAWPAATALAEPSAAAEAQAALDHQPPSGLPPLDRFAPGHPATAATWHVDPARAPHLGEAVERWVQAAANPGASPSADLRADLDRLCRGAQPLACTLLVAVDHPSPAKGWRQIDTGLVNGLCAAGDAEACQVGRWLGDLALASEVAIEACPPPSAPRAAATRCRPASEARPRRAAAHRGSAVGPVRREKRK